MAENKRDLAAAKLDKKDEFYTQLAELITSHVVIKQKCRKLTYKINFSAAIHICRSFFLKNISPSTVETLLLQHLLPIRKGLSNPRNAQARPAVGFSYRIP